MSEKLTILSMLHSASTERLVDWLRHNGCKTRSDAASRLQPFVGGELSFDDYGECTGEYGALTAGLNKVGKSFKRIEDESRRAGK
jgi:hypothetical protein